MTSISQKYILILQKLMNNYINEKFSSLIPEIDPTNGIFNYIDLSSNLDETINDFARKFLVSYFEAFDNSFKFFLIELIDTILNILITELFLVKLLI